MRFLLDNVDNIFIGYVKPKQQKLQNDENPKDFFNSVIQKFCENHLAKTFEEIFDLVLDEMPPDSVGSVKSSDFSLDLRFCNEKKEGICLEFLLFW